MLVRITEIILLDRIFLWRCCIALNVSISIKIGFVNFTKLVYRVRGPLLDDFKMAATHNEVPSVFSHYDDRQMNVMTLKSPAI